jgi:hypothetical protein
MEKMIKTDAKAVVDLLFETKVFKDELTRDNLNSIEEFVGYLLETRINSNVKMLKFKEKFKK